MPGFNICGTGDGPLATVELARKHRWRITVLDNGQAQKVPVALYAYKASRPTMEIDVITVNHGQNEIYLPGRNRWNTVEFSFYEAVGPVGAMGNSVAKFFRQWQQEQTILTTPIPSIGSNYKRPVEYVMYQGGTGKKGDDCAKVIYTYQLFNAWPVKVSPSDLDYTDNGISDISVELRFDRAAELDGQ